MFWKNRLYSKNLRSKKSLLAAALLAAGFLTACGQEPEDKAVDLSDVGASVSGEDRAEEGVSGSAGASLTPEQSAAGQGAPEQGVAGQRAPEQETTGQTGMPSEQGAAGQTGIPENSAEISADDARIADIKKMFGENCIAEQTFEVELSEYSGKVWFVPYMPSTDNPNFRMQIVQNGEVLKEIKAYVPAELAGEKFCSLDAVSFFDVNYDDLTDIVLIETYGNTAFAAVYYGNNHGTPSFLSKDRLSEELSRQVEPLTVPGIRSLLSDGIRNGGFSGYQEAYRAVARWYELKELGYAMEPKYDLIYIDDNEIPELVAGINGYYVSLYSYSDGKVYCLMDDWAYGAFGNMGYEYVPGENSLRNYNTDLAGEILHTTYMTVTQGNVIDVFVQITTHNYFDFNGNGATNENGETSSGSYSVSYIDGKEVSEEEMISYDRGEYEDIEGKMSLDELLAELNAQ